MSEDLYKKLTQKCIDKQKKGLIYMMMSEGDSLKEFDVDYNHLVDVMLEGTDEVVEALMRTSFTEDDAKMMYEYQEKIKDKVELFESKLNQYYTSIQEHQTKKVEEYLKSKGVDLD